MLHRILVTILIFSFLNPVKAVDYMTREQTESAVVHDLPGAIPADVMRERDPRNMTANAFSRTSDVLSQNTKVTLGLVGGIGALGLAGVLSAPVAIIAAAAVGGTALVGALTDNDRRQASRGYAYMNRGHLGLRGGPSSMLGASREHREQGVLGSVFGITSDRGEYGVGALGISSARRAPVHVNMQSPHVLNAMGRGYNFAGYDQNYHTGFSSQYSFMGGGGAMRNTMQHPYQPWAQSQWMVRDSGIGYAMSPESSFDLSATAQGEAGTTGRRGPGSATNSFGAYPGSAPMQGGFGGASPMMAYGFAHAPREIMHPSFDQSRERFNNFFQRIRPAGSLASTPGDPQSNSRRVPWYSNVQYNWQADVGRPQNLLSYSGQYEDGGLGWNQTSPQGRISLRYSYPVQQYDATAGGQYPTANVYNSAELPAGYNANYAGTSQFQLGQGSPTPGGQYQLPPQNAPGQFVGQANGQQPSHATQQAESSEEAVVQGSSEEAALLSRIQALRAQLQQAVSMGSSSNQQQIMRDLREAEAALSELGNN